MILTQAPPSIPHQPSQHANHLIPLSAADEESLQKIKSALLQYVTEHPSLALADLAYTLHRGRHHGPVRQTVLVQSIAHLQEDLQQAGPHFTPGHSIHPDDHWMISLAQRWQQGEHIDWTLWYQGEQRKRLNLPVYPLAPVPI